MIFRIVCLGLFFYSGHCFASELMVYRWVDKNNIVHFSQHQPVGDEYTEFFVSNQSKIISRADGVDNIPVPDKNIPSEKNNTNYQKTKRLYTDLENYDTENLIVCPEVFLSPVNIYSSFQQKHFFYLDKLLDKKIKTTLVFGTELKSDFKLFNSIFIKNKQELLYRIKQKFVPIREFTPQLFQNTLNVPTFYSKNKYDHTEKIKTEFGFIPLVCYESIFSIFTSKKTFNSNFIILATSEEFMNNSSFGKKQYLNIVKLRAIENGRYILKCSNQGISCVINQKGRIVKTITKRIENNEIHLLTKNTFYQKLLSFL